MTGKLEVAFTKLEGVELWEQFNNILDKDT